MKRYIAIMAAAAILASNTKAEGLLSVEFGEDSLSISKRDPDTINTDEGDLLLTEKFRNEKSKYAQLNIYLFRGRSGRYEGLSDDFAFYLKKQKGVDAFTYGFQIEFNKDFYKTSWSRFFVGIKGNAGMGNISNEGGLINQKHSVDHVAAILSPGNELGGPVSTLAPEDVGIFELGLAFQVGFEMKKGLNIRAFYGGDTKQLQASSLGFSQYRDKGFISGDMVGVAIGYHY